MRRPDVAERKAVPAPGQAGLAFVRAGEASLGPGAGHKPRVTGQTLSSEQYLVGPEMERMTPPSATDDLDQAAKSAGPNHAEMSLAWAMWRSFRS